MLLGFAASSAEELHGLRSSLSFLIEAIHMSFWSSQPLEGRLVVAPAAK